MENILYIISKTIVAPLIFIMTLAGYNISSDKQFGATLPQGVALFETSLQSAITSSATSLSLAQNSVRGGSTLSGYNCFTIDEGSSQAEYACGTVSGTTVSGLTRGVDPLTGTSTNATLQFSHRRGANIKITDYPVLQILRNQLNGSESIQNMLNYTYSPNYTGASSTAIVSKGYADSLAYAGSPNADETTKGISELSTTAEAQAGTSIGGTGARLVLPASMATSSNDVAGIHIPITQSNGTIKNNQVDQTGNYTWSGTNTFSSGFITASSTFAGTSTFIGNTLGTKIIIPLTASTTITGSTLPQPVYIATSTGAVQLSAGNTAPAQFFDGFAISSASNNGTVYVQIAGVVSGFTGLTTGAGYYVQDSTGTIGTSMGTSEIYVGSAINTTSILIDKSRNWQYLGSMSLSSGSNVVSFGNQQWREISIDGNCDNIHGQITLTRKQTSGTATSYSASAPSFYLGFSVSVSGNSLSLSQLGNSCTPGGTAYFYK